MTINYPEFRKLTAAEAGGFGGIDFAKDIQAGLQNAAELKAKGLANTINAAKAKYAEQQSLADLQTKQGELGLIPYKQRLLQAQATAASRPKQIPGKISNLEQLRDRFPVGSEQYKLYDTALRNALSGSQGITVYDPKGNPMVQIGGFAGSGGRGSKGAAIYQSPTGEQYITPTNTTQSNLQQRIIGSKLVEPYINNVIENLPQFQSAWTKWQSDLSGFSNRFLGTDFRLPSKLQEGLSSKGLAAEGLLKEFGLNATGKNLQRMEQILTPSKDESVQGYKERAIRQATQFINTRLQAEGFSRSGVPVKELNNNEQSQKTGRAKIDKSKYDIPAGSVLIYKNGEEEPYVYPSDVAKKKVEAGGYSYE